MGWQDINEHKEDTVQSSALFFVLIYQKQSHRFLHFAENTISEKKPLTISISDAIIKYIIKLFNKVF